MERIINNDNKRFETLDEAFKNDAFYLQDNAGDIVIYSVDDGAWIYITKNSIGSIVDKEDFDGEYAPFTSFRGEVILRF